MANVTIRHIIDIIAEILQDESTTTTDRGWTEESLVNYYNLVSRRIVSMAPEANPITQSVKLASGSKQSIPSGGIAFLNAIRNMGVSPGSTPGQAITPTLLSLIESFDLNWSTATAAVVIWNVFPSTVDKTVYYTYPPSDGTGFILIEFSKAPAAIVWVEDGDWENALIEVKEQYVNPLISGIFAMAYEKDTDFPGNVERSADYEKSFLSQMEQI